MRTTLVVVLDVFVEELFALSLVPDEGPVTEFTADGADPSFRVGVRDGRVRRGTDNGRAITLEDVIERPRGSLAASSF